MGFHIERCVGGEDGRWYMMQNNTFPDSPLYTLIKDACETAEAFQKLFYDTMDKRRHLVSKLYMDNAVLSWNGHAMGNVAQIQSFYANLAPTTYNITSLDSIPISSAAVGSEPAILIHVAGFIRLKNDVTSAYKLFTQSLILCHHQEKWKIVSDTFRTQNPKGSLTIS